MDIDTFTVTVTLNGMNEEDIGALREILDEKDFEYTLRTSQED